MPKKIFICYRREDKIGAQALYEVLAKEFGKSRVFIDDHLEPGDQYSPKINQKIADCKFFLVVIGSDWTKLFASQADNKTDFVVTEIAYFEYRCVVGYRAPANGVNDRKKGRVSALSV